MSENQPKAPLILVVDDEEDILNLLKYNLEQEDFEVLLACDGVEGMNKAEKQRPDLIILDVMMPRMDGYEMCRKLREDAQLRKTPILMLTARSEDEDQIKGLDEGADIYLAKPIAVPVLISQVHALLRTRRRPTSCASTTWRSTATASSSTAGRRTAGRRCTSRGKNSTCCITWRRIPEKYFRGRSC